MKKIIFLLILAASIFWLYLYINKTYWLYKPEGSSLTPLERLEYGASGIPQQKDKEALLSEGLELLRIRKDTQAMDIFTRILLKEQDNIDALWGKAEVLRRERKYPESEEILNGILEVNARHAPSLVSLAYIRYQADRLSEARALIDNVLGLYSDNDTRALAYMMLGSINSRLAKKSIFFGKIKNAAQIECFFLKAKELSPNLPEVHLGLGTFYLLAPGIMGGSISKAAEELGKAFEIAPSFATVNARLAQLYKKRGDFKNYILYKQRAEDLDPENEALKELNRK